MRSVSGISNPTWYMELIDAVTQTRRFYALGMASDVARFRSKKKEPLLAHAVRLCLTPFNQRVLRRTYLVHDFDVGVRIRGRSQAED